MLTQRQKNAGLYALVASLLDAAGVKPSEQAELAASAALAAIGDPGRNKPKQAALRELTAHLRGELERSELLRVRHPPHDVRR